MDTWWLFRESPMTSILITPASGSMVGSEREENKPLGR
jgi:hypothetical protein